MFLEDEDLGVRAGKLGHAASAVIDARIRLIESVSSVGAPPFAHARMYWATRPLPGKCKGGPRQAPHLLDVALAFALQTLGSALRGDVRAFGMAAKTLASSAYLREGSLVGAPGALGGPGGS